MNPRSRTPWLSVVSPMPDHQPAPRPERPEQFRYQIVGVSASTRSSCDWSPAKRRKMLRRLCGEQNWRCCYCHVRMDGEQGEPDQPTLEHIVSVSMGGTEEWDNLAAACWSCNTRRGIEAPNFVPVYGRQLSTSCATLADVMPEGLRRMARRG